MPLPWASTAPITDCSRIAKPRDQASGHRLTADRLGMEHMIEDVGPACEVQARSKGATLSLAAAPRVTSFVRTQAQPRGRNRRGCCLFEVLALEDPMIRKRRIPGWTAKTRLALENIAMSRTWSSQDDSLRRLVSMGREPVLVDHVLGTESAKIRKGDKFQEHL